MAIMTKKDIMIAAITPAEIVEVDMVRGSVGIGDSVDLLQSRIPAIYERKQRHNDNKILIHFTTNDVASYHICQPAL